MLSSNYAPYSNQALMAFEGELIARRMAEAGVDFRPATWVRAIDRRVVEAHEIYGERAWPISDVDAVVLATGRLSVDTISAGIEGKIAQLFTIGDALCVRPLATATYEAQKFARLIGEPGAGRTIGEVWFAADDPSVYPAPAA
jgi:hypothetical protein